MQTTAAWTYRSQACSAPALKKALLTETALLTGKPSTLIQQARSSEFEPQEVGPGLGLEMSRHASAAQCSTVKTTETVSQAAPPALR